MKRKLVLAMVTIVMTALMAPMALAQMGQVRGVVKDPDGKPVQNAQVQFVGVENGRKYNLKSNKNGEFVSIGVSLGMYNVTVMHEGKKVWEVSGFPVRLAESTLDINLQRADQAAAPAGMAAAPGLTEDQRKQLQAQVEAQKKNQAEASKVKELNDMLAQATAAEQAGNLDQAISLMEQAVAADATRDVLWSKLAEFERLAGQKATDTQQRTTYSTKAVEHYQKAIETTNEKTPPGQLAAYYNNMGQAYARMNKTDEASAAYTKAAELDPTGAAKYFFNIGAIMTNAGKVDDAIAAFDKTIAADPAHADAFYWKGVNMVGKATLQGDKMIAPPGTDEAFNKYLELRPDGQFAQAAKDMLASIGAEVQTTFGKPKATKKK
ncbi:MAG: tetratricopeptide repeat protein [Candidatus Korobacteraceae bacterium]